MAYYSRGNYIVQDGQILNSHIDMNNGIIINHENPINDTDVANKRYVDQTISNIALDSIIISDVILLGTDYITISDNLSGVYTISVRNIISGGPCGKWNAIKNDSYKNNKPDRVFSSAGLNTEERLELRWNANTGIELKKTGNNYDGQYRVTITLF